MQSLKSFFAGFFYIVIFGLVIATFLTLLVVPVLYSLLESMTRSLLGFFGTDRSAPKAEAGIAVRGR